MNCAVLASGSGSNFQSLIDRCAGGDLHVDLSVLICNNSAAGALQRARDHHIPAIHLAPAHFSGEQAYTTALLDMLQNYRTNVIVLAGYMKKLPVPVVEKYANRIINIHPGLLPAFGGKGMYGHRVHEAVLAYGAKVSGITVHFVDEEYDHGPVILQKTIAVLDNDTPQTLAARVLELEHAHYWRALEALAQGAIRVEGRRVIGHV